VIILKADKDIEKITKQFSDLYAHCKLLLFGSQAKNKANEKSDIDLCVIAETTDKRNFLADMYLCIESDKPFDILLYTPEEWESSVSDRTSFAHIINKEGVVLYGR